MRSHSPQDALPRAVHPFRLGLASVLFATLLLLLALTGGYSRYDTSLLAILRPLLVVIAAVFLMLPTGELARMTRGPAALLAVLGIIVTLQLVPLPPTIWAVLPERAGYMQVAAWTGQPQPWRPLTLVPMLTLNSLLALLPAAVMAIALSRLNARDMRFAVAVMLTLGVASAVLGVIQIGTGAGYLYRNFSAGLPTGFFSNRNHQAVFLASLIPLLAIWAVYPGRSGPKIPLMTRQITAGAGAILFVVTILVTGSRTGLLLAGFNVLAAGWLVLRAPSSRTRRKNALPLLALGAVLAVLVVTAVYLGRGGGISRLAALDAGTEMRVRAWPVLRELVATYLPWGSGFGTFDPLFRMHEPDVLLKPTFFNNAHNDLVELAITGGAPALLLLVALVAWLVRRTVVATRDWHAAPSWGSALPLVGATMAASWLLASLSDYPLRTPFAGAVFMLACCLMATDRAARERGGL